MMPVTTRAKGKRGHHDHNGQKRDDRRPPGGGGDDRSTPMVPPRRRGTHGGSLPPNAVLGHLGRCPPSVQGEPVRVAPVLQDPTADRLEFARLAGARPLASVGYRATRVAVRLLGEERTFVVLANLARFTHRLAYESAGRMFGVDQFHGRALALDDELLTRAVPEGGTVLDLGCGTGRWCRRVARRAATVVGIDHDAGTVTIARSLTHDPNIEYRVGDLRAIGDERFDVVLLVHVLEHVDDPATLLSDLHGVTGTLLVEVPDFESDPVNHARLATGTPFSSDADHVREYTEATLADILGPTGWTAEVTRKRGGGIAALARASAVGGSPSDAGR